MHSETYNNIPEHINWYDNHSVDIATELAESLHERGGGSSNLTLLRLGTGLGKTALAVNTIGVLQQIEGKKIPFTIVASRHITDTKSWNATIEAYNRAHPDNTVEPVLCETFGRLTNIINNPTSLKKFITAMGRDGVLVIDEVHNYKNPTSKRSKALQKVTHLRRLGLSATTLTNDIVLDGCSYLIMAGYFKNKTDFFRRTGLVNMVDQYGKPMVYNPSTGKISEELWPYYPRFIEQLSTVFHSPTISVAMPDHGDVVHQLPFSQELSNDVASLTSAYKKRMFNSKLEYILSVAHRVANDRPRLTMLTDIISGDDVQQPLVFYWHVATRDAIVQQLRDHGYGYQEVSGSTSIDEVDFDDVSRPILIQYQAGSEGIEFPRSTTSVFYENQHSYVSLVQARGRNIRRGMAHGVTHHYVVSDQDYDSEVFNRVRAHEELSDEVIEQIADHMINS